MSRGPARLRADARAIAAAAIEAVQPGALVPRRLARRGGRLALDGADFDPPLDVDAAGRIVVVGGGKASGGMAAAMSGVLAGLPVAGLVSVPEGCTAAAGGIEVRATRPAGINLPTAAAVAATREMIGLLGSLGPADVGIVVVSGGGSALMALPAAGIALEEKIAVTEFLARAGVGIRELNLVRQAASDVKAGGLARACAAGRLLVLVLSDVIGDPLESIASGPCMPLEPRATEPLAILRRTGAVAAGVAPGLVRLLEDRAAREAGRGSEIGGVGGPAWVTPRGCRVEHVVIGSNATAVAAAAARARDLGYETTAREARGGESADDVGRRLVAEGLALVSQAAAGDRPRAVIEGGEATVIVPAVHGVGGRNQQTALAAVTALSAATAVSAPADWPPGLLVASIGTDGEDGPTDAAGGSVDAAVVAAIAASGLDPRAAARRCDAHPILAAAGGLVRTGPTGTNVADLRLLLAEA
jgi:glycerate 2-kinase